MILQIGSTHNRRDIFIRDAATGEGKTGLVFDTPGFVLAMSRVGAAPVAIPLATNTVGGAWVGGGGGYGFVEKSATLTPGYYQLDLPDALSAAGAIAGEIVWHGGGTIGDSEDVDLVQYDPYAVPDKMGYGLSPTERTAIAGAVRTDNDATPYKADVTHFNGHATTGDGMTTPIGTV